MKIVTPTEEELKKAYEIAYKNVMYKPERNLEWETILITLTTYNMVHGNLEEYWNKK